MRDRELHPPAVGAPVFQGATESEFEQFKDQLLLRLLRQTSDAELDAALRHAANEAAAMAWTTPFPLLFLPALVEEKAESVRRQAKDQAPSRPRRSKALKPAA